MTLTDKRYYIRSYGCQMNEQDSLHAGQLLDRAGMHAADRPELADLILINTCSVREKPVHKLLSDLGRLREMKQGHPDLLIGVMGCVAQQEKEALLKKCRDVDLVFGPDQLPRLPELLDKRWQTRRPFAETGFLKRSDYHFVELMPTLSPTQKRAFVTIMKGCDNICSFCIVPYVRGREVSRPSRMIFAEIDALLDQGIEDVTLLGQNVNSYGLKTDERSFTELLYAIAERARGTSLKTLRFTTSHPKDVGPDLIRAFAELEILAPHFHLPVQSGSNRILQLMRRAYTRESFLHIASALKQSRPDLAITTDIIVGFPGETEVDFHNTLSLMDEVYFDGSFSFVYSPRPYTGAGKLPDPIPLAQKKDRLLMLQARQKEHSLALNQHWIGSTLSALVERDRDAEGRFQARTAHNKVVHFDAETEYHQGDRALVMIQRVSAAALYGSVCKG